MQETCNSTDVINIAARSLWEYLQQIQEGIQQGYVLSEDNACFPQAYISLYTVTLVKEEKPEEVDTNVLKLTTIDVGVPDQVKKTAGRATKVQK